MNIENKEFSTQEALELPRFHLEKLANMELEHSSSTEVLSKISEQIFKEEVEAKPGIEGAFLDVSREGTREEFSQAYRDYVKNPQQLSTNSPEMYAFLKDRIFMGREFGLSGMEDFMNKTAPRSWETAATSSYMEIPLPASAQSGGTLEKCQISDPAIGEGIYFSHGSAAEMAKIMDIHQGDNRFGALGDCGLVSTRNLLALCGEDVTEAEVVTFAKIYELADFDPVHPSEELGTVYVHKLPELTARHGVSTELTEYQKNPVTMEAIADKLDHGYRGLFVHNSGLLENGNASGSDWGKPQADHVATFESAVRDGSGNVIGFYTANSSYREDGDARQFVSAARMENALDVRGGALLFTTEPYFNKPSSRS